MLSSPTAFQSFNLKLTRLPHLRLPVPHASSKRWRYFNHHYLSSFLCGSPYYTLSRHTLKVCPQHPLRVLAPNHRLPFPPRYCSAKTMPWSVWTRKVSQTIARNGVATTATLQVASTPQCPTTTKKYFGKIIANV